jgi:aryl-alcohol dehydrogenase-like predicted oxidoreductase
VNLGRTDIRVSRICVGTWQWGSRVVWGYGRGYGEADVCACYSEARSAGVNFFDTAEIYGWGSSERLLGGCAKAGPSDRPVIATKFTPMFRWSRGSLEKALRRSLSRLGVSNVDLYQVHQMDGLRNIQKWMDAMADMHEKGLVGAIGVSNHYPDAMAAAVDALSKRGLALASNQMHLSLLYRKHERNGLLKMCRDENIAFLAYMPFAWGVLAGKFSDENPPRGFIRHRVANRKLVERSGPLLKLMKDIAWKQEGRTVSQVALNWAIAKGAIPIAGVKTPKQAREDFGALKWSLSQPEVAELDAASDAIGQAPLRTLWTS